MNFEISRLSCEEPPVPEALKVECGTKEGGYYYSIQFHTIEEMTDLTRKLGLCICITDVQSDTGLHEIQIMDGFY